MLQCEFSSRGSRYLHLECVSKPRARAKARMQEGARLGTGQVGPSASPAEHFSLSSSQGVKQPKGGSTELTGNGSLTMVFWSGVSPASPESRLAHAPAACAIARVVGLVVRGTGGG